jgi:hypothetical protein
MLRRVESGYFASSGTDYPTVRVTGWNQMLVERFRAARIQVRG